MMNDKTSVFQFDDVLIEPHSFKVWKAGRPVLIEPKAFEVLLYLIRNRGRLIKKSGLLDAVWKGTFVTENALTREIAQLRKALGEEARNAKYIETVPTRGYRFIAEVEDNDKTEEVTARTRGENADENTDHGRVLQTPALSAAIIAPAKAATMRNGFRRSAPSRITILVSALGLACVIVISWWGVLSKSTNDEATGIRSLTQITASTELDFYPSLSPDGSYVAYSSNRSGNFEIYVRQLAPGGREIPITSDGKQNFQPAWSPDGQLIAYYSKERGGIWAVPALGGVARKLTEFGSRPAWSRDGERIAFQSAALTEVAGAASGALPPSTIWVVPVRGGTVKQITQAGTPSGGHGSPLWSPDGKRLVFFVNDISLSEIWSASAEGGDLRRLTPKRQPFSDIVYSPDGKYAYGAGISGASYGLWRVPVSPMDGAPTGAPVKVEGTGATPIRHLSISGDGKKISYSTLSMTSDIWTVPLLQASGEAAGTPSPLLEDTSRRKTNPSFSPDGRKIAFGMWRLGVPISAWLMDADGRNLVELTADPADSSLPGWLPGSDQIAFVSNRQGRLQFWSKNLTTNSEQPLFELREGMDLPRLSPDGKQIAFNSRTEGGTINVWTAALAGGEPRQLTFDHELMGFPSWSPDGKFIALEVKRGDDTHIAVIPSGGGTPTQLTFDPGQSWPHSWSPDKEKIAFAGFRNGFWNIWWVSLADGSQKQLTNFSKTNTYVRYPAWSPRDDQIVFEYAETKGNIWLIEMK